MIHRLAVPLFLALAATILPVRAQDNRGGIAFAYAPEQGAGVCAGGSPEKALACARAKCAENGAAAEDCARVAWCFPAGWSIGVGIMHKEGIHWSEFSCGWPSRTAAIAAGKLKCESQDNKTIRDCNVGTVYDPAGKAEELN